MNLTRLRDHCRALPGVTEQIQWGEDLVFKVGGKMFCVTTAEQRASAVLSFKSDPERFAELCEREGAFPAPYLARAQWVALERWDALSDREVFASVDAAYGIVRAKLSRKLQAALPAAGASSPKKAANPPARKTAARVRR